MEPLAGTEIELLVWLVSICVNFAILFHVFGMCRNMGRMKIAKSLGRKQLGKAASDAMVTHVMLIIVWVSVIGVVISLKVVFGYGVPALSLLLAGYVGLSIVYGFRKTYAKSVKRQWSGLKVDGGHDSDVP